MILKIFKSLTAISMLLLVVLIGFDLVGICINVTPSYPFGLYLNHFCEDPIACKNGLVLVCLDPAHPVIQKALHYKILPPGTGCYGKTAPLIKKLVGTPGDQVEVSNKGISINGRLLENSKIKFKRFEMSVHPGDTYTLQPGQYWVMSDFNPNSLDSRYFGAVTREQITQCSRPLFIIN